MAKIRITVAVSFLIPALILLGSGTAEHATRVPPRSDGAGSLLPIVYQVQLQVRADTGGTAFNLPNGSTFNSVTSNLNDAGNVTVKVNTIGLTTSPGLWFGGHGSGAVVYNANDDDALLSDPFVNQSNQVSFPRFASSSAADDGLYLYDNASGLTTRLTNGPLGATSYTNPEINDNGLIGVRVKFNTPQALMTYNVATTAFINYVTETSADPNSRYSFLYAPAFNNNNRLAAQANINLQPATYKELRVWNAAGTSTLVAAGDSTTGPVFFAMDNSISMNNLDQVAFTTRTSTAASTRRIVVADGTTTTLFPTVSDGAGFTSIDFFAPSINDAGLVAFRGNDNQATPRDSVFVTDGVTFQRIAGVNDTLLTDAGPRVVAFLMGGVSINNLGDVAFGVQFTGGGNAIYVAYQTGAPTPTPTITPTATPTATPTITPSATPTVTPTPTPTPTPTASPSATPVSSPTPLPSQIIYGITLAGEPPGSPNNLFAFNANLPGSLTLNTPISGLQPNERLLTIDFRPATGELYGVSSQSRLYRINIQTAAATAVNVNPFSPTLPLAPAYGSDFNPVSDRLRVVNSQGLNIQLDPNNGTVAQVDTNLMYASGDPNFGQSPAITGLAFSNNTAGATTTTAYTIDSTLDIVARLGSPNGAPASPNSGQLTTIGSLVVDTFEAVGLDIASGGTAYASLSVPGGTNSFKLYAINLGTGAATLGGEIGIFTVADIAVPVGALIPTPTPTATPTPPSTPSPTPAAQTVNLSTRMRVQTGDNVGIGGFIISGTASKHVLVRAIGPSLTQFFVPNTLPDPVLELHGPGGFVTITNNNWRDDPVQESLILATGLAPNSNLESAIDANLGAGAYTAVVRGNNNTTGVALIEVYDLNQAVAAKLANISTRAFVSTGDDIVIAGFILGNQSGNDRIVVRGIGPSLTAVGVPDALANPTLELRDNNGALLFGNNDWQDNPVQAAELTAAGLAPTNPLESGIATTLPPGPYTALLAGSNNGTGVGVVEVYDRGAP
jgi:hypothetical protein